MSLVKKIAERGFSLVADGKRLVVRPADRLTDEQRRFIRRHKSGIIAELQSATVYDLDRHAAEKDAAIKYWRFRHNGVEVDVVSGATIAEAVELLRVGSSDVLEPIIEHDQHDDHAELNEDQINRLLDCAVDGLNITRSQLAAKLSTDDLDDIRADEVRLEAVRGYTKVWTSQEPIPDDDRRYCHQCENPSGNRCLAAARGEIDGARKQHPFDKVPRRCVGFLPGPGDPGQRTGRDRWPNTGTGEI